MELTESHTIFGGVENMSSILVNVDTLDVLAIDIAAKLWPLIYHQTSLTLFMCKESERGSKKAGTNN
jgi:hypothetical protein